jgi:hypothetical protein
MASIKEVYKVLDGVVDFAFLREIYDFDFFDYLKKEKVNKNQIQEFLDSSFSVSLYHQIEELSIYLEDSERTSIVSESYEWMGKFRALKLKNYLQQILDDAYKYERTKRGGRKNTKVL